MVFVATRTPNPEPDHEPRPPAPEPLEVVRQFVNTLDVETGEDAFADARGTKSWLAEHDLMDEQARVTKSDRDRVVELREGLRALLLANSGAPLEPGAIDVLNQFAERSPLEARFDATGTIGVSGHRAGVDGALGQLLAVVLQAVADGTWTRLKACRDDECLWAFYDRSRNRSAQWCVMATCGNRNKARTYRERQRTAD
jgi:predicted RNA-binding Zn ribbon-like protein